MVSEALNDELFSRMERLHGRYRLLELLGSGAMGWVFKAADESLSDQIVALKLFYPHVLMGSAAKEALHQELLITRKLSHPNIVQSYTFETADDRPFITMECVEGSTLRAILAEEQLPLERALELLFDIARGVAHAHRCGVIHRDLKPDNILVGTDGEAKVADFGIAQLVRAESMGATGGLAGTPLYMSPEQLRGELLTTQSDVYAFGLIAFEVLCGKPPFKASSVYELAELQLTVVPQIPKDAVDLPAWCREMIVGCLQKERDERFRSMDEVTALLSRELGKPSDEPHGAMLAAEPAAEEQPASKLMQHVPKEQQAIPRLALYWLLPFAAVFVAIGMWVGGDARSWLVGFMVAFFLAAGSVQRARFRRWTWVLVLVLGFLYASHTNPSTRRRVGAVALFAERLFGVELAVLKGILGYSVRFDSADDLVWAAGESVREDELYSMLWAGANPNQKNREGTTPLHEAVRLARHDRAIDLISFGAKAAKLDAKGEHPLHLMLQYKYVNTLLMEALIQSGADPDLPGADGVPPIHTAVRTSNLTAVRVLSLHDVAIDAPHGPARQTALHEAARMQLPVMIDALIDAGAQVNIADAEGNTALHIALLQNRFGTFYAPIIGQLRQRGADPTLKNHQGISPLDMVSRLDDPGLKALLEAAPAPGAVPAPAP